jgi:hypothetical protein
MADFGKAAVSGLRWKKDDQQAREHPAGTWVHDNLSLLRYAA